MHWREALEIWTERLTARSDYTAQLYSKAVRLFVRQFSIEQLDSLTVDTIERYAVSLALRSRRDPPKNVKPLSTGAANKYAQAVRVFLMFASKKRWIDLTEREIREALPAIQTKVQRPYTILSEHEQHELLKAVQHDSQTYTLILLGLAAGLRAMELTGLRKKHLLALDGAYFVDVQQGKGRRDRQIPISESVYQEVALYTHLLPPEGRLFPFTPTTALGRVKSAAQKAHIERRVVTHALRHTFAYRLATNGATATEVAYMLGDTLQAAWRYMDHIEPSRLLALAATFKGASK